VADLASALEQLQAMAPELLAANRLAYESVRVIGTPRRQTVLVYGLVPRQPDRSLDVQGPPGKVAFDAEGNLTRAGQALPRDRAYRSKHCGL